MSVLIHHIIMDNKSKTMVSKNLWEAQEYDDMNENQFLDGKVVIEKLQAEHRHLDCVVDLGCGTGNIIRQLSLSIPCGRIFGVDVDDGMLQFAKSKKCVDVSNVAFVQQNIALPWVEWTTQLKELEGQADVVICNYVLQNINPCARNVVIENMTRLLKPKTGRLYLNIVLLFMYSQQDCHLGNERGEIAQYFNFPSEEIDLQSWKDVLEGQKEMDTKCLQVEKKSWKYAKSEYWWKMTDALTSLLKIGLKPEYEDKRQEILQKCEDILRRSLGTPHDEVQILQTLPDDPVSFYFKLVTVICNKK